MLAVVYRSCGTAYRFHLQELRSGTDRPSHSFGKWLQTYTGHHPRRVESSTAPRRKSEIAFYGATGGGEDYVVGIATRLSAGRSWARIPVGTKDLLYPEKRPVRIWGVYRVLSREKISRSVNLAIHLHPVPKSRISGAMLLLPYTPSWRGQWQLYCFCLTFVHRVLTLALADKKRYLSADGFLSTLITLCGTVYCVCNFLW